MNISISSDKNGSTIFTLNGGSERAQQQQQFSVAPDGTITFITLGSNSSYTDDKQTTTNTTPSSSSSSSSYNDGNGNESSYQEPKSTMMAPLFVSPRRTAPAPTTIAVVERVEITPRDKDKHHKHSRHHKGSGSRRPKEYKEHVVIRRDQAMKPIPAIMREEFNTPVRDRDSESDSESDSDSDSSSRSKNYSSRRRKDRRH